MAAGALSSPSFNANRPSSSNSFNVGNSAREFNPELDEKFAGGLIHDRLADHLFPSGCGHQFAIEQRFQNACALHSADIHDFRSGDGLFVGHHC